MSEPEIIVLSGPNEVAESAARRFVDVVRERQSASGTARVALSGGSTPRALFGLLASDQHASKIDWSAIDVFWGDERTVPPDHAESNFRMAWETLLSKVHVPEDRVHRMQGELDPELAAADYERVLVEVFQGGDADQPPILDLILLGLGGDGHTASLFPGTQALSVRDRLVVANVVPQQHTTRLTVTVPVLQAARTVLFLATGGDKAPAVRRAIEGGWNPAETPSQYLREAAGHVVWMLDDAAAAQLHGVADG